MFVSAFQFTSHPSPLEFESSFNDSSISAAAFMLVSDEAASRRLLTATTEITDTIDANITNPIVASSAMILLLLCREL